MSSLQVEEKIVVIKLHELVHLMFSRWSDLTHLFQIINTKEKQLWHYHF
jgi:hypothetical protein